MRASANLIKIRATSEDITKVSGKWCPDDLLVESFTNDPDQYDFNFRILVTNVASVWITDYT